MLVLFLLYFSVLYTYEECMESFKTEECIEAFKTEDVVCRLHPCNAADSKDSSIVPLTRDEYLERAFVFDHLYMERVNEGSPSDMLPPRVYDTDACGYVPEIDYHDYPWSDWEVARVGKPETAQLREGQEGVPFYTDHLSGWDPSECRPPSKGICEKPEDLSHFLWTEDDDYL